MLVGAVHGQPVTDDWRLARPLEDREKRVRRKCRRGERRGEERRGERSVNRMGGWW